MKSAIVFFAALIISSTSSAHELVETWNQIGQTKSEKNWFSYVQQRFEKAERVEKAEWDAIDFSHLNCVEQVMTSRDTGRIEYGDAGTRYRVTKTKIYETVPEYAVGSGSVYLGSADPKISFQNENGIISGASAFQSTDWKLEITREQLNGEYKTLVNTPYAASWGAYRPSFYNWEFTLRKVGNEFVLRQSCQDKKGAWCPSGIHPTAVSGFNFLNQGQTARFCVVKAD